MFVTLKFSNNIALFGDLSKSEKATVSGLSSVLLQAYVLAAISVKFFFSQNKMVDFSLRISYLFKVGFYSFHENPNFVFSKRSVDVRDNKTEHRPTNNNTLLTALLDNSFTVCSSIHSNFLPFSLLSLRIKLNYQLRNPAAANSDFSLELFIPTSDADCQEFVLRAELFVFCATYIAHTAYVHISSFHCLVLVMSEEQYNFFKNK
jgi:hypothetical protein